MAIESLIKKLQDIMRGDDLSGTVQYLKQTIWMIFLKVYDAKEQEWELIEENYISIIPDNLKWRNWAVDNNDGKALTGDALLTFVNSTLIKSFKEIEVTSETPKRHVIVRNIFEDASNFMKNGYKLRQMINALNEVDFTNTNDTHEFGDLYESMLKDLQESKRDGGEFYTPRALTDFITEMVDPRLGDSIADFACGTGGFLVSALKHLERKTVSADDKRIVRESVFGIEKKSFPYSLGLTNLILHDVDEPKIYYDNSLNRKVNDYQDNEKFDVILMNPPYGGTEDDIVKMNFPTELRSSETADLFMAVIMYRLKLNGRAGVVLPDGFLFGDDNAKSNLKKKLLEEYNLHTIIRLPKSVFAPYTSITTNVLFFEKNGEGTKETWFYRLDLPKGYKAFSKTKTIQSKHFQEIREWWLNRQPLDDEEGNPKIKRYTKDEITKGKYNLDLCGFPHKNEEILDPYDLMSDYIIKKGENDQKIKEILDKIKLLMDSDK
ncbi:MAG: class I SAM-dependent DNA methyltransferase [Acholeplasmataceae bacterium]